MISVIIPTYNPNIQRLQQTINALKQQSLSLGNWECIIVDNNSSNNFYSLLSIEKNFKYVLEPLQGLTYARLKGFTEAKGDIIIMVDDDNVLDKNYLKNVHHIFEQYPQLGAIGGNISPEFEIAPPDWTRQFWDKLAIRNLGDQVLISEVAKNKQSNIYYPAFAPVGAGMAIRIEALGNYISVTQNCEETITDRKGDNLSSSGDNEIIMFVLKAGFEVGFFPVLRLVHLIPASRLTTDYFVKLNYGIMYSWTKFLLKHNISSWQQVPNWSVPLRKMKSYFTHKAWRGKQYLISWKGVCGMYDGLSK